MGISIDEFMDVIDLPIVVVNPDLTLRDLNRAFSLISGIGRSNKGMDIREIGLFRSIRVELTEALLKGSRKRLHLHHGENVYEVQVKTLTEGGEVTVGVSQGGNKVSPCVPPTVGGEGTVKSPFGERIHLIYLIDVTRYIQAEKELLRKNRELMIANSISNIFITSSETEEIYGHILEKCMLVGDFGLGCIVVPSVDKGPLILKAQRGFSLAFQKELTRGLIGDFIKTAEPPMRVFDREEIQKEPSFVREGVFFLVIIPLISGGTVLGYLLLGNRQERVFDLELASVLSLIGNNVSLVFDKIRLFKEMERLSITDALTGLFNRRYFYEALDKEIERVKRYGTKFSIVLIDIDDFKRVNDEYGHLAGDRVLQALAGILKRILRKVDVIARYGGEEFILLLPNTGKEEASVIANRIREEISRTTFECPSEKGRRVICPITISGGVTTCPDDFSDPDRLLSAADKAMYEAKALGKNRIVLFQKEAAIFEDGREG